MAEHLLGNVYQIGGGDMTHPLDGASYVIVDREHGNHALIDCGSPLGGTELERHLNELDIEMGRVAVIYATHGHYDHVAEAAHMPDAQLYIHADDQEAVLTADPIKTAAFLSDEPFPLIPVTETIDDGYETAIGRTVLRAITTPGHTPGSVSYKLSTEEGMLLIAGDTLWGGYHKCIGSDLDAWEQSLGRLARDRFDYVSFGHGVSWLVPDAMAHINKARSHFRVDIQPSHNGRYFNPWAEPQNSVVLHNACLHQSQLPLINT